MTDRPQDEESPRVVIRDRRRIDPTSGQVRQPAGTSTQGVPVGTTGPGDPAAGSPTPTNASTATPGEQMSEQTGPGPEVDQPDAAGADVPAGGSGVPQDSAPQGGAPQDSPAQGGAPQSEDARQLAERTEDLQRVSAEYANYRRRVDRDRALVVDQAAERFAAQLIPVVDDIERAREHGDLTGAFKVVADRVLGLLDGLGVIVYGTSGDPFDPALHEAVLHDSSPDVAVPTASTVLRQGFRRGDRVLRPAMVGVTDPEGPAPAAEQPADGQSPAGEPPAS